MAGPEVRPFYLILVHPTLRILGLFLLAVVIQFVPAAVLVLTGLLAVGFALWRCARTFVKMLRRSKWLLLTLLLIFSFSTPGEFVHGWPIDFAPTYEGLEAGAMQLIRLVIMLSGLSVLLESTGRDGLVAGIYVLLRPLGVLGLPVERFTVRLWLTLNYVERSPASLADRKTVLEGLADLKEPEIVCDAIRFKVPLLNRCDGVVMVAVLCLLLWWTL